METATQRWTPLHTACQFGNVETAKILLTFGADINRMGKQNVTPLHVAAKYGQTDMTNVLLRHKPNVSEGGKEGI